MPIHPLIFLLLYAGSFLLPAVLLQNSSRDAIEAAMMAPVAVQVYWTVHAAHAASRLSGSRRELKKMMLCFLAASAIVAVVISHDIGWGAAVPPALDGPLAEVLNVTGGAGALLFFAVFWFAASAMCEADVRAHSFGWTFLAFLYLPLGAFFIYPRLKRARQAASEPNLLRQS